MMQSKDLTQLMSDIVPEEDIVPRHVLMRMLSNPVQKKIVLGADLNNEEKEEVEKKLSPIPDHMRTKINLKANRYRVLGLKEHIIRSKIKEEFAIYEIRDLDEVIN